MHSSAAADGLECKVLRRGPGGHIVEDMTSQVLVSPGIVRCNQEDQCANTIIKDCENVVCDGFRSCAEALINAADQVDCEAEESCAEATIDFFSGKVACLNRNACQAASIEADELICRGFQACFVDEIEVKKIICEQDDAVLGGCDEDNLAELIYEQEIEEKLVKVEEKQQPAQVEKKDEKEESTNACTVRRPGRPHPQEVPSGVVDCTPQFPCTNFQIHDCETVQCTPGACEGIKLSNVEFFIKEQPGKGEGAMPVSSPVAAPMKEVEASPVQAPYYEPVASPVASPIQPPVKLIKPAHEDPAPTKEKYGSSKICTVRRPGRPHPQEVSSGVVDCTSKFPCTNFQIHDCETVQCTPGACEGIKLSNVEFFIKEPEKGEGTVPVSSPVAAPVEAVEASPVQKKDGSSKVCNIRRPGRPHPQEVSSGVVECTHKFPCTNFQIHDCKTVECTPGSCEGIKLSNVQSFVKQDPSQGEGAIPVSSPVAAPVEAVKASPVQKKDGSSKVCTIRRPGRPHPQEVSSGVVECTHKFPCTNFQIHDCKTVECTPGSCEGIKLSNVQSFVKQDPNQGEGNISVSGPVDAKDKCRIEGDPELTLKLLTESDGSTLLTCDDLSCKRATIVNCDIVECIAKHSCEGASIKSFTTQVVCESDSACLGATLVASGDADLSDHNPRMVVCEGSHSCENVQIDHSGQELDVACMGSSSCKGAKISTGDGSVYCKNGKSSENIACPASADIDASSITCSPGACAGKHTNEMDLTTDPSKEAPSHPKKEKHTGCYAEDSDGNLIQGVSSTDGSGRTLALCGDKWKCKDAIVRGCDIIKCLGLESCINADLEEFEELLCLGENACIDAAIQKAKPHASIACESQSSCEGAKVDVVKADILCYGAHACGFADISIGPGKATCSHGNQDSFACDSASTLIKSGSMECASFGCDDQFYYTNDSSGKQILVAT